MDTKDAYIEQLENTIKNLQEQVSNLTEMIMLLRKEKFAPSSEKTVKQMDGQLSLFNETELGADDSVPEPITKEVKGYVRKSSKTKREEVIKGKHSVIERLLRKSNFFGFLKYVSSNTYPNCFYCTIYRLKKEAFNEISLQ